MRYVIKNTDTGEYLYYSGMIYVWVKDLFDAKIFKTLKGAKGFSENLNTSVKFEIKEVKIVEV